MRELIDSGRYDTHNNFTVVLQPFFREVFLPKLEVGADTPETINIPYGVFIHLFLLIPVNPISFSYKNGQPDRSYFSPDCFHLSQKAHTLMARALWNNMVGFILLQVKSRNVFWPMWSDISISIIVIQNKSLTLSHS